MSTQVNNKKRSLDQFTVLVPDNVDSAGLFVAVDIFTFSKFYCLSVNIAQNSIFFFLAIALLRKESSFNVVAPGKCFCEV